MIIYLPRLLSPVRIGGARYTSRKGISLARRVIEELVDDLDGEAVSETITFSYRGADFEVDLSENSAAGFDDALAPYIAAARKVATRRPPRASTRHAAGTPRTRDRSASGRSAKSSRSRTAVGCRPLSYGNIKTPRRSGERRVARLTSIGC